MCNINSPKIPRNTCVKNVDDEDKAVKSDLGETWVQIKSNNPSYKNYRYLQNWG